MSTTDPSTSSSGGGVTLTSGEFAWLYGYRPVLVVQDHGDGFTEVCELAPVSFVPTDDVVTGDRSAVPEVVSARPVVTPSDFEQVKAELAALREQLAASGAITPAPAPPQSEPAPATDPTPAPNDPAAATEPDADDQTAQPVTPAPDTPAT